MIDFSGINLPFNVTDLLTSGTSLLHTLAPYIMLVLGFRLLYLTITFIKSILDDKRKAETLRSNFNKRYGTNYKKVRLNRYE